MDANCALLILGPKGYAALRQNVLELGCFRDRVSRRSLPS